MSNMFSNKAVLQKILFLLTFFFFFTININSAFARNLTLPQLMVVPQDQAYYSKQARNVELIYTEKDMDTARKVADLQMLIQPTYEEFLGYKLDETLRIGITSQYNQEANGFATQIPFSLQANYNGGPLEIDFFATTSWIKTLAYHETMHNFQMNAKDSAVSRSMHSVIKNGIFIVPWFNNPNIVAGSFLMEGNAVLNESWHGNGGRLYSGRFKVATLLQAKAGLLTPELVFNDNLNFLYGQHFYTLGSYYQYFLAENYGLKKTNSFWLINSRDWIWPFKTNYATKRTFGKDFETLIAEWSEAYTRESKMVIEAQGELLASSQFFAQINADNDEIYFITNPGGREYPDIVIYDKHKRTLKKQVSTYTQSKVIKTPEGEYVVQASRKINPWRKKIGLYDEAGFIIDGTESRVIEGFLKNGKVVYFDVELSYDQPRLFVGDEDYGNVNSSVLVQDDDIYYFRQKDKKRTLYKNKKAIFTFNNFYSYVIGANDSGIYFIANTEHGTGLYRYANGRFDRMNPADTIFSARLVDKNTALVTSMGSDEYKYMLVDLKPREQKPYELSLFMEKEPYYEMANPDKHAPSDIPEIDLKDDYYSLLDMHYSGTNISLGSDSKAGFLYDLNASFVDPLLQNKLDLFITRNTEEYTLGGVTYANYQYFLQYELTAYGVMNRPDTPPNTVVKDKRNSGLIANASIPFLESGYYYGDIGASYFEDYTSNSRKPVGANLTLGNAKRFGVSMDTNFLLQATAYGVEDRGDKANGGKGIYKQGLPYEFFITTRGQYSSSDAASSTDDRGIKIASSQAVIAADSDLSTIIMPSIKTDPSYAKKASKVGIEFKKVFNFSAYYFTFPISLRREAFYLGYNRYEITDFSSGKTSVNETIVGLQLDTLFLNILPIPIKLEYIHNDNENIADTDKFQIQAGFEF